MSRVSSCSSETFLSWITWLIKCNLIEQGLIMDWLSFVAQMLKFFTLNLGILEFHQSNLGNQISLLFLYFLDLNWNDQLNLSNLKAFFLLLLSKSKNEIGLFFASIYQYDLALSNSTSYFTVKHLQHEELSVTLQHMMYCHS